MSRSIRLLVLALVATSCSTSPVLWGAVERNHFFERRSHQPDGRIQDGGFLSIFVVARGETHDVVDYQVPVRPLVSILETMNQVVPARARIPAPF